MDFLKHKNNFLSDFFERRQVHPCYDNVYNTTNEQDFHNIATLNNDFKSNKIVVINNIPSYLDLRIRDQKTPYGLIKIHYLEGFMADLRGFANVDAYMKTQFSSNAGSKLRAYVRRLENCFPIRYKMFYGDISLNEFNFLMDTLEGMIRKRFSQRGDTHERLSTWDFYKKNVHAMVLDQKASLFVIYNKDKPIDISLNYNHQNIVVGYIKSYDIDYSKFRVGLIDIYKQIEWCIEHQHTMLDMSHGDLEYKRAWSNKIYPFEHHILYNKTSFGEKFTALCIAKILRLKAHLKKQKVDVFYHKIATRIKSIKERKEGYVEPIFEIKDGSGVPLDETALSEIDITQKEFAFLRKPVYDFQYLNFELSDQIKVFKIKNESSRYIVRGLNKQIIMTLKEPVPNNSVLEKLDK